MMLYYFTLRRRQCPIDMSLYQSTKQSFLCCCTATWNRLQTELKVLRLSASFRQKLKTVLFWQTYGAESTAV